MAEIIAAVSGIMKVLDTVQNVADGRQNGLRGLTQLTSNFGSLMSTL